MTDKKKCQIDCKKVLKDLPNNYWAISTVVLAILVVAILLSSSGACGTVISTDEVGQKVIDFANNQYPDAELVSITDNGQLYEVILLIQGQEVPVYTTKDGENLIPPQGMIPLTANVVQDTPQETAQDNTPKIPIYECVEKYGISNETIIFYYSDGCGYCTIMKPGVEALEKEGYNFKWIEGSNTEDSQIINECIRAHMGSGGVPQFICPKTSEIHTGAFIDANRELDKEALKTWVDNCIAN